MTTYSTHIKKTEMKEITKNVEKEVKRSGIKTGVCVISLLDSMAGIVIASTKNRNIHKDIMDDLDKIFPPRVNYLLGENPFKASAKSKSALIGVTLHLIVDEGQLDLKPGQGIYIADFVEEREIKYVVSSC